MNTFHAPSIGLVELPDLSEVLRQLGYRIISGATFPEAAAAVKTTIDEAQSVADASGEAVDAFPVLIADVHRPGIKAWAQKLSRTSPVLILRLDGADYIAAVEARSLHLPATVAEILATAGLEVTNDPRMSLVVDDQGSIIQAATVPPSALEAAAPSTPVWPPAPSATAPEWPPTATASAPTGYRPGWDENEAAPALSAPIAPVAPVEHLPVSPVRADAPAATVRAPWDSRPVTDEVTAPVAAPESFVYEPVPQTLFPNDVMPEPVSARQHVNVTAEPQIPATPAPVEVAEIPAEWTNIPAPPAARPHGRRAAIAAEESTSFVQEFAPAPAAPVAPAAPAWADAAPAAPAAPVAPAAPAWANIPAPAASDPVTPDVPEAVPAWANIPAPAAPAPTAPVYSQPAPPAPTAPTFDQLEAAPSWANIPAPAPAWSATAEPSAPVPSAPTAPVYSQPAPPAPTAPTFDQLAPPAWDAAPAAPAVPAWSATAEPPAPTPTAPTFAQPAPPTPTAPTFAQPAPPAWDAAPAAWETVQPAPTYTQSAPPAWESTPVPVEPVAPTPSPSPSFFGQMTSAPTSAPTATSQRSNGKPLAPCIFSWAYKGGVNKTSLTLQLAHRAADKGMRVWVVDMNRGQGGVRTMLRISDNAPIRSAYDAALFGDPAKAMVRPEEAQQFRDSKLEPLKFGIALAPPRAEADPGQASYLVYRQIIDHARANGDLVIVDTQTVEATDTSGLIDNVMLPLMVDDAFGVAITEFGKESVENLKAAFTLFSDRGLPRDRQMLVVTRVSNFTEVDAQGVERKFQSFANFAGTTAPSDHIKREFDRGRIISDDPAVTPLLDSVLRRATGDTRFDGGTSSTDTSGRPKRRGMFGGGRK